MWHHQVDPIDVIPATPNDPCFLGGGFKDFFFVTPILGEMIQFDEHIFQMGWFNHHLVLTWTKIVVVFFAGGKG